MNQSSGPWERLIVVANARVSAAERGEKNAALDVVSHCAVALRGLVRGEMPDPERMVYLGALLNSLERIEDGTDPVAALHLRPKGRVRDESLLARNILLFVDIGHALDELTGGKGHTRSDSPVAAALKRVQKETGRSDAQIKKVWQDFGAARGWERWRELYPRMVK